MSVFHFLVYTMVHARTWRVPIIVVATVAGLETFVKQVNTTTSFTVHEDFIYNELIHLNNFALILQRETILSDRKS